MILNRTDISRYLSKQSRLWRAAIPAILLALALAAQSADTTHTAGKNAAEVTIPANLKHMFDVSAGMPAEVAAKTLIEVSELQELSGPEYEARRRQWIEQAFGLAMQARFPYRMAASDAQSSAMRSVEGQQAFALGQSVDTLSLETRAVESLLRFDPAAAVELFTRIPLPRSEGSSCTRFLVAETAAYYRTLGHLLRQRRRLPEKTAQMLWVQARDAASSVEQVEELAGLLSLIGSANLSADERQDLTELTAASVSRIPGTDQTPWWHYENAQRDILTIPVTGGGALLREAWTGLLARQEEAVGCDEIRGEAAARAMQTGLGLMKDAVKEGMTLKREAGGAQNFSFYGNGGSPSGADGYDVRPLFVDDDAQGLWSSNPTLLYSANLAGSAEQPKGVPTPYGPWRASGEPTEDQLAYFRRWVERLADFRARADIHSEVRFHEICQLWIVAVQSAPDEAALRRELTAYANYLAETPMLGVDPPSWIYYSRRLLAHWNSHVGKREHAPAEPMPNPPDALAVLNGISPADRMPAAQGRRVDTKGPAQTPAPR